MKTEVSNQGDEHVSERCRGQHVSEVGPRKRGDVTGEECEQKKDSQCYPGVEDRQEQGRKAVKRDVYVAEFFHTASQQGIARRAEDGDSGQDEVFSECHFWSTPSFGSRGDGALPRPAGRSPATTQSRLWQAPGWALLPCGFP